MIVYVDSIILENFVINSALLNITFKTLRLKVKVWKMILSSMLGSIYVLTIFLDSSYIFISIYMKLFIALLMILILMERKEIKIKMLTKTLIIFLGYSILLAGITYYMGLNVNNFTLKYIYLSILIIYLMFNTIIKSLREKNLLNKYIYDVEIHEGASNIKIKAFLDTGNGLREPITRLPVMLLDKETSQMFFIGCDREYLIPYRMINGEKGILHGFKPDYIKIICGNKVMEEKVIIAFGEDYLSKSKEYSGLLSRGIID
ncbi:MAG TPA: sigma-E processing peptidase SpoIIGA [Clostridiaceae bacterium]